MGRFHYTLQPALDDARTRERSSLADLARARARVHAEQRAIVAARDQARAVRAGVARSGSRRASTYVEAGLRLAAIAAAQRERGERLARASRIESDAATRFERTSAERRALEGDRERKHRRWLATRSLREARDLDEANALRRSLVHTSEAFR